MAAYACQPFGFAGSSAVYTRRADFSLSLVQWLEFGVASGATLTWTAKYREAVCASHPDISSGAAHLGVVGFDTFTGLPEVGLLCEQAELT